MQISKLDLLVNILTYAIKNKDYAFSQKDFKNVVYTNEFDNFELNEDISKAFTYLLKSGLLQLKSENQTFYEKYTLSNSIKINTHNYTNIFKELSKRIILMHDGIKIENDSYEIKDEYMKLLQVIDISNLDIISFPDKEQLRVTFSKILLHLNKQSNENYSLITIIQLLKLQSLVSINIETKNHGFSATNVKFLNIQFNDESISFDFNKCSFELDNIEDIKNLECTDILSLEDNLKDSLEILKHYPQEEVGALVRYLNSYNFK